MIKQKFLAATAAALLAAPSAPNLLAQEHGRIDSTTVLVTFC